MKDYSLHIVIYSEILEYGGGRETWLEYFLNGLLQENYFKEIWVHHLSPRSLSASLTNKIDNVRYNMLDIGFPEKNSTLLNMAKFTSFINVSLKKYTKNNDIILFVGTGMESISALTTYLILSKKIKILIWVRSIIGGELMSRKSNLYSKLAQWLEKKVFRIANGVIFNGRDTRDYYNKKYDNEVKRFFTIENAVKYNDFSILGIPDFNVKPFVVGYIGRFSNEKGFDNLLDVADLLSRNNSIKIEAWGHGMVLNNIPKGLVIHDSVMRNKIPDTLQSCHAVLFLNKAKNHEAGGLSHGLLEAMAAGRLIIAWDNIIHRQVLNEGNSILIPEGDIEMLAKTISNLTTMDTTILTGKCKNSRLMAREYSIEMHIKKFMQLVANL